MIPGREKGTGSHGVRTRSVLLLTDRAPIKEGRKEDSHHSDFLIHVGGRHAISLLRPFSSLLVVWSGETIVRRKTKKEDKNNTPEQPELQVTRRDYFQCHAMAETIIQSCLFYQVCMCWCQIWDSKFGNSDGFFLMHGREK